MKLIKLLLKKLKYFTILGFLIIAICFKLSASDFKIVKIKISNNNTISKAEILQYLGIKENQKVEISTLLKIKEKLLNWGYFSHVEVNFKKENNKITIDITVVENSILTNINIFVNKHKSIYYKKYITLKPKKAFNPKILEKDIENFYKLDEILQVSYKIISLGNDKISLEIYITKKIVIGYYLGFYNFLNFTVGLEKIDFIFPFNTYVSFFYINKKFVFPDLYFNLNFNFEIFNKVNLFLNFPFTLNDLFDSNSLTSNNINTFLNFIVGLSLNFAFFNREQSLFFLYYNYSENIISFYTNNNLDLYRISFISKFKIYYNPFKNTIFLTNSSLSYNDFNISRINFINQISTSLIIPYYSIRGYRTLDITGSQLINSQYSFSINLDFIYKFYNIIFLDAGIILSNDLIFFCNNYLNDNFYNNILGTIGVGIYIEAGIKNIFTIPLIIEIFTNIKTFKKYSIYLEVKPYKIR